METLIIGLGVGLLCLGTVAVLMMWTNRDQLREIDSVDRRITLLMARDMKLDEQERRAAEERRNGYRNAIENSRNHDSQAQTTSSGN